MSRPRLCDTVEAVCRGVNEEDWISGGAHDGRDVRIASFFLLIALGVEDDFKLELALALVGPGAAALPVLG